MNETEFGRFQKELVSDPTKGPVSHGTGQLLALMGGVKAPKRPPQRQASEGSE